jgi:hypothetical protein
VSELVEEIPFSTDSAGTGTVTVQPAPASQTVEVCDDDGCVYGDAEIQPAAGDGASDVEGDEAPTATDAVDFDTDGGEVRRQSEMSRAARAVRSCGSCWP